MSQWLPAYQLPEQAVRSLVRAFVEVFPNAVLLSGWRQELILIGRKSADFTIDPAELAEKLARYPAVQADLSRVNMGTVTEIVASFIAASSTLASATVNAAPVTDDDPLMEYAAPPTNCWTSHFPKDLIDVDGILTWCPTCFDGDGRPNPHAPRLRGYLAAHRSYYQSDDFLSYTACSDRTPR